MDLGLRGRTALLTGATGTIGAASALALAAEGVALRLTGRREEPLRTLASQIVEAGGVAEVVACDLTDPASFDRLLRDDGDVDLLVHAAGHRFSYARLHNETAEDAAAIQAVEVEAFSRLCQRAVPGMMARRFGRIVAVTSLSASLAGAGAARYAAAKAALEGMVRALAVDYGRFNVTANAVAPGFVRSERFESRLQADNGARFENSTSLKRFAEPREVAAPVVFLCSAMASYVTGTTVTVAGGLQLNNLW